ncbi:hypothetical protein [uncultured Photobacterium sp.]|uniref:hypothetical protein n=1 Tax=uncultured Photobacterium sp. TaxID=173973 RepID=UPI002623E147|nr:hypothetical protein [uncultured Photobacterium sp.]
MDNNHTKATRTTLLTVNDFKTSKFLVSNQEFMDFVRNDGYLPPRFWNDEGKAWLEYTKAKMPRFWRKQDGK